MCSSFSLSPFKSHVKECPLGPSPPLMWESVGTLLRSSWLGPLPVLLGAPPTLPWSPILTASVASTPSPALRVLRSGPPPQPRLPWPTSDLWAAKVPPKKFDASRHSLGPVHQTAAGCLRVPLFLLLCPLSPCSPVFQKLPFHFLIARIVFL